MLRTLLTTSLVALWAVFSPLEGQGVDKTFEPSVVQCSEVKNVSCEEGDPLFVFDRTQMERVAKKLQQGRRDSIKVEALEQDTTLLSRKATLLERKVGIWKGVAEAERALQQRYAETLEASEDLHASEWDYMIEGARYWLPVTAAVYLFSQ